MKARQLWFASPGEIDIREQELASPGPDEVLVKSLCSAVSTGSELLVYRGQLPDAMALDANLEALKDQGSGFPVHYGYAIVGTIEKAGKNLDSSLTGKTVYAFHPHASHFVTPLNQVVVLPEDIDPEDGVFLANMETAINLLQDGQPLLGESVVVIGLGVVGLLVTRLLSRFPLACLVALDRINTRCELTSNVENCLALSVESAVELTHILKEQGVSCLDAGADLVFELTGNPDALNLAIGVCGFDSRIVVGSWYGTKTGEIRLGGTFHRDRLKIISSQVSTIAPQLTGRWSKTRRLQLSLEMLRYAKPRQYISHRVPFDQAAKAYDLLDNSAEETLQVLLEF